MWVLHYNCAVNVRELLSLMIRHWFTPGHLYSVCLLILWASLMAQNG